MALPCKVPQLQQQVGLGTWPRLFLTYVLLLFIIQQSGGFAWGLEAESWHEESETHSSGMHLQPPIQNPSFQLLKSNASKSQKTSFLNPRWDSQGTRLERSPHQPRSASSSMEAVGIIVTHDLSSIEVMSSYRFERSFMHHTGPYA